jgi:hypothetical protein
MADIKGVAFNRPPIEVFEQTNQMIHHAVSQIGKGDKFLFVAVATTKGTNVAAVQKLGDHVEIVEYIGKTWGEPLSAGVSAAWHF